MSTSSNGTERDSKLASWTGIFTLVILLLIPLVGYLAHENAQVQVSSSEIDQLRTELTAYSIQAQTMSNQLAAISQKLTDISDSLKARSK